eukprot:218907_1
MSLLFKRFCLKPLYGHQNSLRFHFYTYNHQLTQWSASRFSLNMNPINTNTIDTNGNTILTDFFKSVELYPYRFACIYNGNGITYRELYHRVLQAAVYLRNEYNIMPSDVVSCITSNRPEYFQLILACHLLNCTFLPLNSAAKPSINIQIIKNTNVKLIIHEHESILHITKEMDLHPIQFHSLCSKFDNTNSSNSWIGGCNPNESLSDLDALQDICQSISTSNDYNISNICQFMSTSGTTGTPKLITHSFENKCISSKQYEPLFHYYSQQDISSPSEYPSGCRILLTGATFHVTTYNILTCSASNGHCAVIPSAKQRSDVSELWKLIELNGVNASCFLSSTIYSLIKHGRSIDGHHFKSAYFTGEIVPSELVRKFMKLMADGVNNNEPDLMRIINFYGSTECEVVGFSDPISINCYADDDLYDKTMTIRKIQGIDLRMNNEIDRELQVSTPCLMQEYHADIEKTCEVISVDEEDMDKRWYLIGEQVTFMDDENESFIINARNKDIFITEGSNCYPQTVENVLLKHDLVNGAVVMGIGYGDVYVDEELPGLDEPVAFITVDKSCCDDDIQNDELIEQLLALCEIHLQKQLGEIPFKIFIVDDIPKTSNGKVLRHQLKDMAVKYFKTQQFKYAELKV